MNSVWHDEDYPHPVVRFGNPRIKGCVLLPAAFRSLLRPSSPVSAKASTVRPYLLDHIILSATSLLRIL